MRNRPTAVYVAGIDGQGIPPSHVLNHVAAAESRRTLAVSALIVISALVLYSLAPMWGNRAWLGLLIGFGAVVVIVPFTVHRARAIARSDRPILAAIETMVLLLTLLVFGFATIYVVLSHREGQLVGVHTKIDAIYFTVTTLSTVGYGDAHARGQAARLITTLQIIFDLVFIAVAIRLLASVARQRATERRTQP